MKLKSMYEEVTNSIMAEMEKGLLPWEKPWKTPEHIGGLLPENVISGKPYSGMNIVTLWGAQLERGFLSSQWLTYKQANEAGGNIRKGEKGTRIIFTKWVEQEQDDGSVTKQSIVRTYHVWNIAQVEGLDAKYHPQPFAVPDEVLHDRADAFYGNTSIRMMHGGKDAYYAPGTDHIAMPPADAFEDPESYYATLSHEHIHATGHKSRLDRALCGKFGDKDYAFEELIAELGGAFICAHLGVEYNTQNNAAYIRNWLTVLDNDKRAIFRAASYASQAANWVIEDCEHAEHSVAAE